MQTFYAQSTPKQHVFVYVCNFCNAAIMWPTIIISLAVCTHKYIYIYLYIMSIVCMPFK